MRKFILLFLIFVTVMAVGCTSASPTQQPAPQETSTLAYPPPQDTMPQGTTDYPAPVVENPANPEYPGPAGVPALEARANVKVELVEQSEDPENPTLMILQVKLVSATPAEGSPDRFTPMIGQFFYMHANKEGLPSLSTGDMFTADVIYRGDETNRYITAENIQK